MTSNDFSSFRVRTDPPETDAPDPTPSDDVSAPKSTPFRAQHEAAHAKMTVFAGYALPLSYEGVISESLWTRRSAGLFDVSHMGQVILTASRWETLAESLEKIFPTDIARLAPGQQRYTQLLTSEGGVVDDAIISRPDVETAAPQAHLVINGALKARNFAYLQAHISKDVHAALEDHLALLALQGPEAARVLAAHCGEEITRMPFMSRLTCAFDNVPCVVSRAGYTGEDGFEISLSEHDAPDVFQTLLANALVRPAGLGARDALRLEAGLCLYGHDLGTNTTPVEAGLAWSIPKRRRADGDFYGAAKILKQYAQGPDFIRTGLAPEGKQIAREGLPIHLPGTDAVIGRVTSGGFSPSLGIPIAMGYVNAAYRASGTALTFTLRSQTHPLRVADLPFVPGRYYRTSSAK